MQKAKIRSSVCLFDAYVRKYKRINIWWWWPNFTKPLSKQSNIQIGFTQVLILWLVIIWSYEYNGNKYKISIKSIIIQTIGADLENKLSKKKEICPII